MYMSFNVKEARDQLISSGYVFTLRKWDKYPKSCIAVTGNIKKRNVLGNVKVKKIDSDITDKEQLETYVIGSGFETVDEWWSVLVNFGLYDKGYTLYLVEGDNLNAKE